MLFHPNIEFIFSLQISNCYISKERKLTKASAGVFLRVQGDYSDLHYPIEL
jgi:hypothetical protein